MYIYTYVFAKRAHVYAKLLLYIRLISYYYVRTYTKSNQKTSGASDYKRQTEKRRSEYEIRRLWRT